MEYKLLVLNMWNGGELLRDALAFIKTVDADFLLLQEVYDGHDVSLPDKYKTLDILRHELKGRVFYYAPEFIDNRQEGNIPQGNAIFSRYPLEQAETVFFDRPLDEKYVNLPENYPTISRNLQIVISKTPTGDVYLVNFHGVWDLDGDNFSPLRKKMQETLIEKTRGKSRLILGGDTNAKPTNLAMLAVGEHLISVFGNDVPTTFNMRRKDNPGYSSAAVDMVFVSKDIAILEKKVVDVDVSDHLPLVVKLKV